MAKAQTINLVQHPPQGNQDFTYCVKSTTNRLTPRIGEFLTIQQVRDLMQQANTKVNVVGRA